MNIYIYIYTHFFIYLYLYIERESVFISGLVIYLYLYIEREGVYIRACRDSGLGFELSFMGFSWGSEVLDV